jgi:pyridoxine kinase
MKTALIISSFVAASQVGAGASAFCLRRLGVDAIILPTTLFGRHPGWGFPGGEPVPRAYLDDMWRAVRDQRIKFDAVLTGYMARTDHVDLAAKIMFHVKQDNPEARLLVDPVMGDHGRLYVNEDVAGAIIKQLLPIADLITPNLWELEYMSGDPLDDLSAVFRTASRVHPGTIITSIQTQNEIGAALVANGQVSVVTHKKFDTIPHGGGDALAGTLLANWLKGYDRQEALARSVASIFSIIQASQKSKTGELPLVEQQEALISCAPLPIERFTV